MPIPEFTPFPKIARLSREIVITEKIDGTNAQIYISEEGEIQAGSRTRWIYPEKDKDNYGFAAWVDANKTDLLKLGPGQHFGEWWGKGIQRGYAEQQKRFSLFHVGRWGGQTPENEPPNCCSVVPVLFRGPLNSLWVEDVIDDLRKTGSKASPGFMKPEGIVIFHSASGQLFKKTLEKDESPKGLVK